jgi:pathogen-inducible salicylic acid glucosyltransferase
MLEISLISDGDIEPEILFTHAYDRRRRRIARTIEKLGFSLCFWV